MAIEKQIFRQVLGKFATGVTIATTRVEDTLIGLTVNSLTSVSLEPPLVLICISNQSYTLDYFRKSQKFAINILTDTQKELANCFAGQSKARFEHFGYAQFATAATGAPIIDGILAFIDTRIVAEYPGGDHQIFVGQVEAMGTADHVTFACGAAQAENTLPQIRLAEAGTLPLSFFGGKYHHLTNEQSVSATIKTPVLKAE